MDRLGTKAPRSPAASAVNAAGGFLASGVVTKFASVPPGLGNVRSTGDSIAPGDETTMGERPLAMDAASSGECGGLLTSAAAAMTPGTMTIGVAAVAGDSLLSGP